MAETNPTPDAPRQTLEAAKRALENFVGEAKKRADLDQPAATICSLYFTVAEIKAAMQALARLAAPEEQAQGQAVERPAWAPADATHGWVSSDGEVVTVYRRVNNDRFDAADAQDMKEWTRGAGSFTRFLLHHQVRPLAPAAPAPPLAETGLNEAARKLEVKTWYRRADGQFPSVRVGDDASGEWWSIDITDPNDMPLNIASREVWVSDGRMIPDHALSAPAEPPPAPPATAGEGKERISVAEGKYTVILRNDGTHDALRYGKPWPAFEGRSLDNLHLGLARDLSEARAALADAEKRGAEIEKAAQAFADRVKEKAEKADGDACWRPHGSTNPYFNDGYMADALFDRLAAALAQPEAGGREQGNE